MYRGKRIDNGKWVYGTPIMSVNNRTYMIHGATEDSINTQNIVEFYYCEVDTQTVGQLVKEHNGVRYFDGDIGRTKDEAKLIVILTWINKFSLFGWLTPEEYEQNKSGTLDFDKVLFWTYAFDDNAADGIEIIGNVTDNPELLKVE